MGKCLSGKKYQFYEYLTAVMISTGVAIFLLCSGDHSSKTTVTTFSGRFCPLNDDSDVIKRRCTVFSLSRISSFGIWSRIRVLFTAGLIMLVGYVLFDSFTSNWQGELFSKYKMTSFQMMCGVNFFSIIFCGVSLIEQGGTSFISTARDSLRNGKRLHTRCYMMNYE